MEYRLDELFDLQMGKTPSRNNPEYWNSEDHKWISIGDLSKCGKYILDTKEYLSDTAVQESGISCIPANTVIMSFKLSIGKTAITKEPIYSNEAIMSFRDKHIVELLPDYIFYMFTGKDWEAGTNKAVMGKTLNKATLSAIKVSIHPISEQRRIVEVLDKASSIIEDRQRELTRLDELIRARFVEMFGDPVDNPKGWRMKKLQELVSDDCTISYGIVQTGDDQEEGIPVFRPVDIVDHVPTRSELKKTTEEISNKYKRTLLKGREMLITVRANIADTCIVGEEFVGCNVGRGIVPIRTNEDEMILEFLKHQIDSKHLNDNIKALAKGITLIQLNMEDLREISLIVPPIEQQKAYVEFAKQTDKSKYQAEPNSRKYYIHRLRKQYQELTDSLFLYFTKLFEVIIFQKGIC